MFLKKAGRLGQSISSQINILVFTIYSVVAFTTVTLHITAEYRHVKDYILESFLTFQNMYREGITDHLNSGDLQALKKDLHHKLQYPDLIGIRIEDYETHQVIMELGLVESQNGTKVYHGPNGKRIEEEPSWFGTGIFDHTFLIEYPNKQNTTNSVEILLFSNNAKVLERANVTIFYSLVNLLLISTAIVFSYLFISRILLTRPLSALTSAAQSINMDNLEHFKLIVETPGRNELKILEQSIVRMVRQLLAARKKLEIGILNLKQIAEEGLKISSQRSFNSLSEQVKLSFSKITDMGGDVQLVFSGKLFGEQDDDTYYFVGQDDQSIVEVPKRIAGEENKSLDRFRILDTKDASELAEVRFINHYTHQDQLVSVEPLVKPLLTNISNTIKNISMIREIRRYIDNLEQNNIALKQMDKIKDEFLANTSHELQTPLNGIIGISESLLDGIGGEISPEQQKNLNLIVHSGKKLSRLINDILDFSKLKNQQLRISPTKTSVKNSLDIVLGMLAHAIKDKGLLIRTEIPEDLVDCYADESRLQQVLFNLIGNAIKYTREGKITISAREEGEYLEISVSDTGIGIEEQHLSKLFAPFEQLDGTISKEHGGTGLGLSISKSLIELQGGEINVKSIENVGSVFSFTLPRYTSQTYVHQDKTTLNVIDHREPVLEEPDQDTQIIQTLGENVTVGDSLKTEFEPEYTQAHESKTILIVDDEMINLQVLINHLKLLGYRIISAKDGFEALDQLKSHDIDLVLLDLMMPKLSGYEVCEKIRETYSHHQLPVIILTAKNQIEDLIQGFESGANDYITKPFYKEELIARVKTHLEAKNAVERLKEVKRLEAEILLREKTEQELESSQRRMIRMLDLLESPIVSFDIQGKISFFNRGAEALFGYQSRQMLGQSLEILLNKQDFLQIRSNCEEQYARQPGFKQQHLVVGNPVSGASLSLTANLSNISSSSEPAFAIIFEQEAKRSASPALDEQAITSALSEVADLDVQKRELMVKEVRELDGALDGVTENISEDRKGLEVRQAIVDLMTMTLTCWETDIGKSKINLAEESEIWKTYLDKGTYRTRTMDKYFLLSTLPKKPRWRSVISTALFVSSQKEISEAWKKKIESAIQSLQESLCSQ